MSKKSMKPVSLAIGTAFVASLVASNVSAADINASPFAMNELSSGYMLVAAAGEKSEKEGKCGEDKAGKEGTCGEDKAGKEGKCGEGKCGDKKEMKKNMEGKCGEDKAKKEGKCGEGKCGEKK